MFSEAILWKMTYCPPTMMHDCWQHNGMLAEMGAPGSFCSQHPNAQAHVHALPESSQSDWPIPRWRRASKGDRPGGSGQDDATASCRHFSPGVDIPGTARASGDAFLVPLSCQSICHNYNDLLIGGDQVLPLSASTCELVGGTSMDPADGPFLQSCDIPPALESPPRQPVKRSSCWRGGSGKERSLLLQGGQPLSNSQLNQYLEQKMTELYRQHMVESMARGGSPSTMLASELLLTSVDHITLQLSREQNLEAAKAKEMVMSCLLRVASGLVSSEISTPQLQISTDGHAGAM